MRAKLFFVTVVMLVALVLSGCAGQAAAQVPVPSADVQPTNTRTITVMGSGEAFLTPDIAYINIGVHTESADANEAVSTNTERTQQVTQALQTAGIASKDIQTTNFSIWPQQQYDPQGNSTGEVRYAVDNTVMVTLRDLTKVGDLLDSAVKAGANSINGIQFDVADKTAALSDARKAAVENARQMAEELATASGVELGQVYSLSFTGNGYPYPMPYGRGGGAADMAASSVPVNPGQLNLTVNVSVTYEIQ